MERRVRVERPRRLREADDRAWRSVEPWVSLRRKLNAGVRVGPGGCWLWTGAVYNTTGYGKVQVGYEGGRFEFPAHRLAWLFTRGPIGRGMTIVAWCENRLCCNPGHLESVSSVEPRRSRLPDPWVCGKGHSERVQDRSGNWWCRACNREKKQRRRAMDVTV